MASRVIAVDYYYYYFVQYAKERVYGSVEDQAKNLSKPEADKGLFF